jgi:hypothetical protein
MKLKGEGDNLFEMFVVGYEAPDVTEDHTESNWLIIGGSVVSPDRSWRFSDACLTTFELADLADWFRALGEGLEDRTECEFIEPNLAFRYMSGPAPVLRVRFAYESAPPELRTAADPEAAVVMDFPLPRAAAVAAAEELEEILADYPIRGGAA